MARRPFPIAARGMRGGGMPLSLLMAAGAAIPCPHANRAERSFERLTLAQQNGFASRRHSIHTHNCQGNP